MLREFFAFLREYHIVTLAIGFVMGTASTALVNSLVRDVVMPVFAPLLQGGEWKSAILAIGPVQIAYGSFLSELLNFVILGAVIFFVSKKMLRMNEVHKV